MRRLSGLTLTELLMAVVLFSIIVLALNSIHLFSHFQALSSVRRTKLQNEVSMVLEHMTKEIGKAIGSVAISGQEAIDLSLISGDKAVRAFIDLGADCIAAGDGRRGTGCDRWIAYRFRDSSALLDERYQIWYYADYAGGAYEVIAKQISAFNVSYDNTASDGDVVDNYVDVSVTACWDPTQVIDPCGSPDNPSVMMNTRIRLPALSTN